MMMQALASDVGLASASEDLSPSVSVHSTTAVTALNSRRVFFNNGPYKLHVQLHVVTIK